MILTEADNKIIEAAVNKWGVESQLDMACEECAEFIAARNHYRRQRASIETLVEQLTEEAADAYITLLQVRLIAPDLFDWWVRAKLDRLAELVGEAAE